MLIGRFHLVTFSGGGNTVPTYALVRRLIARGHEVTILGQMAQAEAARNLGARFVPLGVPDWTPGKSLEEQSEAFLALLFGPDVGKAVLDNIARDRPDVLVVDCMLTSALAAAERAAIRSAALVHVLYEQFVAGTVGRRWAAMLPVVNEMRSGFGLPPVGSPMALLEPMRIVLVACPQAFDVAMPTLPKNVRYVGAMLDDPATTPSVSPWPLADGRPRMLVAFSTTCQHQEAVLRRIAAALATLPVEAVITTGPAVAMHAIDPARNVAVFPYIAHRTLLPDCALVITHAGLGAVMAALAHGVPLLCMPMGRDQHDNAARVAACGAGCVLPLEAGVGQISQTISAMLAAPEYRTAARDMAATIARRDGRDAAVEELENLLLSNREDR
jgi:MGT family glycosyltransferase